MVTEHAIDEDGISWLRLVCAQVTACSDDAYASRVNKQLVARAALHHFGITRYDLDPGLFGRIRHAANESTQRRKLESFLDDHGAGQVERFGTADREVVDGSTDRKRTDIATWELKWIDDERVRRESESISFGGKVSE